MMMGLKMPPRISDGANISQQLSWGPVIVMPGDEREAKKALARQMPRDSFHQTPRITYPQSPSLWRSSTPGPHLIPARIVEQPDSASLKKQCIYRKKLEKQKFKAQQKKSDFFLSKYIKLAKPKLKEIYLWNEKLKPERLEALIQSLNSSVKLERLYAAQALGHLGVAEEHIVSSLYNTLQECESLPLQYEIARSLALLGCLKEPSVMKVLIRHLKDGRLNRREDILSALKISLHSWSMLPEYERPCIGGQASLTRNLQRLVKLEEPMDNVTFNAAICLGYVDVSNPLVQTTMSRCLTQKDWKRKMEALVMLIYHMGIGDAVIIQTLLKQLQCSPVCQVVRQSVVMTIEELNMKKQVWDIVEKQLKEENEEVRRRAVISLGVLGIRQRNVFFTLLEMLDLDSSEEVRIQVIRTFSTLGMNNIQVRKNLKNKAKAEGNIARECAKALKILDKIPVLQKELMLQSFWLQ